MPFGQLFAAVFFLSVAFAGITSLINMFEAVSESLQTRFKLPRKAAVAICAGVALLVVKYLPFIAQIKDDLAKGAFFGDQPFFHEFAGALGDCAFRDAQRCGDGGQIKAGSAADDTERTGFGNIKGNFPAVETRKIFDELVLGRDFSQCLLQIFPGLGVGSGLGLLRFPSFQNFFFLAVLFL
ncbi:hypothetical protein SDC9_153569 [bioreactor metagenome]|uniref:Uncharacterized protein n=1 Tax=bioreactor metagenome TaxID=1076179 RepID=A0A645F0Y1_9ZZZZ